MRHASVRLQVYIPGLNTTYWYYFEHAYWIVENGAVITVVREDPKGPYLDHQGKLLSVPAVHVVAVYFREDVTGTTQNSLVFGSKQQPPIS